MNIVRIAILSLPLLVASNAAFADSEDKKRGAVEPRTPVEEPKAEATPEVTPPAPAPAPPPAVGTTQTTAAYVGPRDTAEAKPVAPQPNPVADRWSLEPLIGYGTANYNFGVGGRIGYTFETPVYFGTSFMWYGGETNTGTTSNAFTETKATHYVPALEFGYDISVARGRVMLRPYGGAGIIYDRERVSVNRAAVVTTTTAGVLYPGVTARYNIPDSPVFLGADTRLLVPTEAKPVSYQAFFVTGLSM